MKIETIKYCACGCGEEVKWNNKYKRWNRFIHHHRINIEYKKLKERKPPLCECGCKEEVKWCNTHKRWNKFITGHNNRGVKFPPRTKEHCENLSKASKNRPPVSEETRKKQSIAHTGFEHTEESKKKMSKGNKGKIRTEEHKRSYSKAKKGVKKPPRTKEHCENLSKALTGEKHSKERIEKRSKGISQAYLDGKMNKTIRGKSGYYFSNKNNKDLFYRSSYELVAYELLEQISKVKSYETEPFRIQYEYRESKHHTIPDILITYTDDSKELVEVKPEYKLKDEKEQTKLVAMKNYSEENGIEFSIWTEKELKIN